MFGEIRENLLKTNPRPPIGPWLPLLILPSSLVLMQMCPQPTPLLLSQPLPATRLLRRQGLHLPRGGGPQILQSWQPRLPVLAQATSKIFLLTDLSLAIEVSHLGNAHSRTTGKHSLHSDPGTVWPSCLRTRGGDTPHEAGRLLTPHKTPERGCQS